MNCWEFIFGAAGELEVRLPDNPDAATAFEIVSPQTEPDKAAMPMFSRRCVEVFLGETGVGTAAGQPARTGTRRQRCNQKHSSVPAVVDM